MKENIAETAPFGLIEEKNKQQNLKPAVHKGTTIAWNFMVPVYLNMLPFMSILYDLEAFIPFSEHSI